MISAHEQLEIERAKGPGFGARLMAMWLAEVDGFAIEHVAAPTSWPKKETRGENPQQPDLRTHATAVEMDRAPLGHRADVQGPAGADPDRVVSSAVIAPSGGDPREVPQAQAPAPDLTIFGCCPSFATGKGVHDPRCESLGYYPKTGKDWDEEFAERAAIIEYQSEYEGKKMTRARAEHLARQRLGERPR